MGTMGRYTSTQTVIAGTQAQSESAHSLNVLYNDLYQKTYDPMMTDLMAAGVPRATALVLTNASTGAMQRAAKAYLAVYDALGVVASTLDAVEKAKTAAESESPRGKFVIN